MDQSAAEVEEEEGEGAALYHPGDIIERTISTAIQLGNLKKLTYYLLIINNIDGTVYRVLDQQSGEIKDANLINWKSGGLTVTVDKIA